MDWGLIGAGLMGAGESFSNSMAQSTRENAILAEKERVEKERAQAAMLMRQQEIMWQEERAEEKRSKDRDTINETSKGYADSRMESAVSQQRAGLQSVLDDKSSSAEQRESARQGLISIDEAKAGGYQGNSSDDVTSKDRLHAYAETGIKPNEGDMKMIDLERQETKDKQDAQRMDLQAAKEERAAKYQELKIALDERKVAVSEKKADAMMQGLMKQGSGSVSAYVQKWQLLEKRFPNATPAEIEAKMNDGSQFEREDRVTKDERGNVVERTEVTRSRDGSKADPAPTKTRKYNPKTGKFE